MNLDDLPTPTLLVDESRLDANIARMQARCNANGVALWPHVKTHKTVEIARKQLAAGAAGLTCAKLGEAEALLPSGVRRVFVAFPLVDIRQAERLHYLADALDELLLAATSLAQAQALDALLEAANVSVGILLGVDSGLGREGVRSSEDAQAVATFVRRSPRMRLVGLFTHEGHAYSANGEDAARQTAHDAHTRLLESRAALRDPALTLWPGCSITAQYMAELPDVYAVRPGAYVFGDLLLSQVTQTMRASEVALTVLATVADHPAPGLALLDAGAKTLSGDKTPGGICASAFDKRDIHVTRVSEEHGWATGNDVDTLHVGDRLRLMPAHVCPAVNLANELVVLHDDTVTDRWTVAARGRVQ